nr:hypothetical protein [Tanacetum cinerariifolium]
MILGSLKKSKKQRIEDLKPREQESRCTSGNTTRIDPFPPSLILEAQTQKMAPKRTTRANPSTTKTTTTTSVTDAQLEALIEQGVARALATRDADRNTNGNDSHNSETSARRTERVTRECTYPDFMKYKPLNFKGTEGVVGLSQWFEKMESVYSISNCTVACQVKFATCTLQGNALTWWNSHVKTTTPEATHAMP